jgi:hypothetical protein
MNEEYVYDDDIDDDIDDYIDLKECISRQIFEYDGNGYIRPSEENCNEIADRIISIIGV